MDDPVKPVISSLTIRALIVAIITLLGLFGVKCALSKSQIRDVAEGVLAGIQLVSMALALYGRLRARQTIGDPVNNVPSASPAPLIVTAAQVADPQINTNPEPAQTIKITTS